MFLPDNKSRSITQQPPGPLHEFVRIYAKVALLFLLFLRASCSSAEAGSFDTLIEHLKTNEGVTMTRQESHHVTIIRETLDEKSVMSILPKLQKWGVIYPSVDLTTLRSAPITLIAGLARQDAVGALVTLYDEPHVNSVKLSAYISFANSYGHIQHQLLFSFQFNRKLAKKINWENFEWTNLDKVAPHFHNSTWFTENVSQEVKHATQ